MTRSGLGLFQAAFQPSIVKGPRGGVSARACPQSMKAVVAVVRTVRRVEFAWVLIFFSSLDLVEGRCARLVAPAITSRVSNGDFQPPTNEVTLTHLLHRNE